MPVRYSLDCESISRICADPKLTSKQKNKACLIIEERMIIFEQRELDGKSIGGYYE